MLCKGSLHTVSNEEGDTEDDRCRDNVGQVVDDCHSDVVEYFKIKYAETLNYEEDIYEHCYDKANCSGEYEFREFIFTDHATDLLVDAAAGNKPCHKGACKFSDQYADPDENKCSNDVRDEADHG